MNSEKPDWQTVLADLHDADGVLDLDVADDYPDDYSDDIAALTPPWEELF